MPFTLWLLRAFFPSLAMDLEHAARVGGVSRFQELGRIVVPQGAAVQGWGRERKG
jgi:ABC-type glycerol-3-phosphate transport system permease component